MPVSLSLTDALGHALADKRIDILRQIGACGSISQAARAVGVSYKAAWQAVDTLTNLAGTPLVARAVGGAGGGGAQLTEAGHQLLAAADAMAQARGAVLSRWQATPHAGPALARLAVRTSMRNQLPCVVDRLVVQGPLVWVHLRLGLGDVGAGGAEGDKPAALASRITLESAELLGLQPGLAVQALCKATAVRVERRERGASATAAMPPLAAPAGTHRLPAKATRVVRGEAGDEVSAELAGGLQMVGFAAPGSGLRAGSSVELVVEDNAVVLALVDG
ncbi:MULTISPECIES: TOBE domain-containing protein [unclassified Acidovorax]|jgi:molybdate transport system regulatory protein|uniref:TOBE domain-containing protein n=1 Tax=unclassified Acidovorax TaxID=2684926 RepID=UPI000BD4E07A|nr:MULTISPECIES: TOBE domain-containing protein [unclassified Acidovorax]OZA58104.1 MAG: ModE family transcriptional regulator [Acidovorax sp. 17-64-282]HQS22635.1 LysR family transcriptional regulator [Acidovorax defluvii]OYY26205.1 MAG: ModE family transcriptional regulator [Acidovorax sp. 35-64-16]OYY85991.1 MAG: ModE family transcriptional regulator [Acidovorax sp. 28-64-14]OYZ44686.1 MAG: ModE family transcriptional regulator [Acidovorax sp. 16-64-162]